MNITLFTNEQHRADLRRDFTFLGVLRLLDAQSDCTQREIARSLGMSLGKANYIVKGLLAKRLIKVNGFRRDSNRRGYIYLLTGEGISAKAELTRQFLAFKIKEYDALRIEIDRLRTETPDNVRVEARQTWP